MTYIPLYPFESDPLRILSARNRAPAGEAEQPPAPAPAAEPPGESPSAPPGASSDPPPAEADGDSRREDARPRDDSPDAAEPAPDSAEDAAASSPPGERPTHEVVVDWMNKHWDLVTAMAEAGEAPQRPAPPPPEPAEGAARPVPRPVPYVAPGDRWNKPKMGEFLRQLAATHSVSAAARAVGMNRRSAYRLRNRLKGQPFDIAWEAAFRQGYDELAHAALELALEGEEVPHYYRGERKGTHRKRHPALVVQLLKMRNQAGAPTLGRYNAAAEYWSENWDQLVERVETGPVTWEDDLRGLSEEERARLQLPDERQKIDRIIERNLPDEPRKGRSGP